MIKNITNVKGIKCWGAHSGVKSLRRDLALIYSVVPANAAAVFTRNKVVAEPIKISRENIKGGIVQAIVINAGNANACTGKDGYAGAEAMMKATAKHLDIDEKHVLVASTGIIGKPFPTEDIVAGIEKIAPKLSNQSSAGSFAANAILTTDTYPKEGFLEFELHGREVNMGGIAKGSGMIHPNMGTMLAFIVTDAAIESALLQRTLKYCVDRTFNMITVDGDTSTNDMVAVMANGKAENDMLTSEEDEGYTDFRSNLLEMMEHLSKLIISDGEGSSKFVEYKIVNASNEELGRKLARSISSSNLVKTAMFGRDPNWGRIICAAGNADVPFDYEKVDLFLGNEDTMIQVLEKGVPLDYDVNYMKKLLRESHISVKMDLQDGDAEATAWGTDLTTDYVLFNSVYST
ncbi:bifunctional glutamate N-acetyltransferase/amino-acid acetyltransferase ArgJ [Fulvivirgaceae bacterium LMO-SS25]